MTVELLVFLVAAADEPGEREVKIVEAKESARERHRLYSG